MPTAHYSIKQVKFLGKKLGHDGCLLSQKPEIPMLFNPFSIFYRHPRSCHAPCFSPPDF